MERVAWIERIKDYKGTGVFALRGRGEAGLRRGWVVRLCGLEGVTGE